MSPNARAWLRDSADARVLHLFDDVCNLISDDGMLSLVTQQIGDGPFSLVVPQVHFPNCFSSSAPVDFDMKRLRVGELEVDVQTARVWDPRPDWRRLRKQRDRLLDGLPHLTSILQRSSPLDSLAGLVVQLPAPDSSLASKIRHQSRESADKLSTGLLSADVSLCKEGAEGLVGLGSGLTPSGDDWMIGSLLGTRIIWEEKESKRLTGAVRDSVAGRTTPLSAAMIFAASHGECGAPWHDLFEVLVGTEVETVHAVAERIMVSGHTSGADALAGFVAVMRGSVSYQD